MEASANYSGLQVFGSLVQRSCPRANSLTALRTRPVRACLSGSWNF